MRGILTSGLVAAGCAVMMGVSATAASASPYVGYCGTAQDGSLTADSNWVESGPWYVAMSYPTAASIARRIGPSEFQSAGSHPPASAVPCTVAAEVAARAANAWSNWAGNDGTVGVGWTGYAVGPYFGRFGCSGTSRSDGGARETCVHFADRHAGQITVQFSISPAAGH